MALIKLPKFRINLKKLNLFPGLKKFRLSPALKKLRLRPERKKYDPNHPLKVAFYTDTFLPNVDGVVNAMLAYREELAKRGDEVYIFTSGTDKDASEYGNSKTFYFESLVFPPYPQYKVAIFPFSSINIARKSGVQLIHSHAIASMGLAAIASAKALNLPLVGTFHTMVPKAGFVLTKNAFGKKLFSDVTWGAIRQFYSPFDLVTAPTRTIEKLLNENGITHTAVSPNGIDLKKFNPSHDGNVIRTLLGIGKHEKIILTAGRLSDEKNVNILIEAFSHLLKEKDAKLIIQGDGPSRPRLQKLAKKLNIDKSVIFTGFVKSYEVPYFYCAADVFATASTFETQGLALLEAMASGSICVGAKSLAIPELIQHNENGYLFHPNNSNDLCEKKLTALDLSKSSKNRIIKNAIATAGKYSKEKSTDALLRAYEKVL